MDTTAIATLRPVWDCRWSYARHGFVESGGQPRESHWMCTREKKSRQVLQKDCSTCTHWEPRLAAAGPVAASTTASVVLEDTVTASAAEPLSLKKILDFGTRVVLGLTAAGLFAVGFTQLASVMAVPFVIMLWLSAAALVGIVVFSPLDANLLPYADRREHGTGSHGGAASYAELSK